MNELEQIVVLANYKEGKPFTLAPDLHRRAKDLLRSADFNMWSKLYGYHMCTDVNDYKSKEELLSAIQMGKRSWELQAENILGCGRKNIVDLGCSMGVPDSFRMALEENNVIGIDISEKCIERANMYKTFLNLSNVEFRWKDVIDTSIDSNWADLVIARDIVEHVKDPQLLINESYRILRPGGLFSSHIPIGTWHDGFHLHYFDKEKLYRLFNSNWKCIQFEDTNFYEKTGTLVPTSWEIIFQKKE